MTVKEQLHQPIDDLDDESAEAALEYVEWLASEYDTLTPEELSEVEAGEAEITRGEYVTLDELLARRQS